MLADYMGLPWLSTGEFLRMLISGERRKEMLAGKLINDSEIIALVQKIFNVIDTKHEFIIDGFPRTVAQADWLLNQSKHEQLNITAVVHLKATKEAVRNRLLKRGRQDDTETAIDERFREYTNSILPILEHFKEVGIPIYEINAEQKVDSVQADIRSSLKV